MEKTIKKLSCVDCVTGACLMADNESGFPSFCLSKQIPDSMIHSVLAHYDEEENHNVMQCAVKCEALGQITRVQETIRFAKEMGYKRIGIANCVGLNKEANIVAKILRYFDFEVFGVSCKCGRIKKAEIGLDVDPGQEKINICDPILQAEILADHHTDFNILVGLCVGHDSLFCKYSHVLTTTLVTKDKATGHNPAVVLYQLDGVFNHLIKDESWLK